MSEDDPLIGTRVADRYRVERKLGEGGMGLVYLAVHEGLRKHVALKVLTSTTRLQRESIARFEREAVAAGNLKHPNIAEATDFGQLPDGGLYLVMEYVEGATLRELLAKHGKVAPDRALAILQQVGAALGAAHARDVVHRDLKPENVIVSDAPSSVKVIDFGIAKLKSATFGAGGTGLTKAGSVFGTAEYMSPEQVMGQPVDARADQYALGVLAFELLTGKPPFKADDAGQLMMMHVGAPVPSTRESTPGLPPAVDEVIAKMLGKLPDERFGSVTEAMEALTGALRAEPSPPPAPLPAAAIPAPTIHKTLVSPRRDAAPASLGRLLLLGAGGALLLIAVLVVVLVMKTSKGTTTTTNASSELAAALAEWNAGRYEPAGAAIGKTVLASPEIAELESVSRPLASPVGDENARRALTKLLDATPLGRSRAMAAALADAAVTDEPQKRDAALGLLQTRQDLLSDEQAARVRLRDAETCEALAAAKDLESEEETAATTRDLERLDLGDCKVMLRVTNLCDACTSAASPRAAPDRGRGKGLGKRKKQ